MFAMVMKAIMMSEPTMYPWAHASTTSAFCWVGMGLCPTTFAATSRRSGLIAVVRVFAGDVKPTWWPRLKKTPHANLKKGVKKRKELERKGK
jgi:hypothetical protein